MIRDVTELREQGQVCRRVAALQVDPDTWRAGMRRAARREGMRIRTFLIEPPPAADTADTDHADPAVDVPGSALPHDQQDPVDAAALPGLLVYAVRTDLPPERHTLMAMINQPAGARLGPTTEAALRPVAPVTSLAEQRARRSGHPCTGSDPD